MDAEQIAIRLKAEQEAIRDCETIPIHNIGYIQPFGYLIAVDIDSGIIVSVSENIREILEIPANQILGSTFKEILPREIVHQCNNALAHSTINTQREYVGRLKNQRTEKDVFAHAKGGRLILEFQANNQDNGTNLKMLDDVHRVLANLKKIEDVQPLLERAVLELRALSGFHRVKAYLFSSDGSGEITAESREPHVDSFLGHRFPAYDIPESARKLYEQTPIRIIPSIGATQVNLLSHTTELKALDLSLALFRGIVPVHMLYLQNMGVGGTLSLPITVNGKMWGLFAFHHMRERMLDSQTLAALELLGSSISLILNSIIYKKRSGYIEECTRVASSLFVQDDSILGFSSYWETASTELATLINCDGVALINPDRFDTYGTCPNEKQTRALCQHLSKVIKVEASMPNPIGIDSINSKFADLDCGDIAGVLAIPSPAASYDYLLYFRKDTSKTIRWAGKPTKDILKTEDGFRLIPRGSFEEYKDSKLNTSDTFDIDDMLIAVSLQAALAKVLSNFEVQIQHRQRMGLVIRELNHRVRNMLALIGSIITQTKGASHNIEDFVQNLEARIMALSETQKLLTEHDWEQVNIDVLFKHALVPYNSYLDQRLTLEGDEISLSPPMASLLALILNELASNASKYGALSNAHGKVDLTWQYAAGALSILWKETGGPIVAKPTRHGFGTTLIREALSYEFNAQCSLDFDPLGVSAKFVIPVAYTKGNVAAAKTKIKSALVQPVELKSFVALVLEDDYIIAKEMSKNLKLLGATKVDEVPSIESAFECIEKNNYDVAFLDANIRGEFSIEVASLLDKKGIPFVFVTGYGSKDQELNSTACIEVLSKPVSKSKLLSVLKLANFNTTNE